MDPAVTIPMTPKTLERLLTDLDRSIPTEMLPPVSTGKHVAAVVGTTEGSLAQDRYLKKGIPYTRIGSRVRYLRADVLAFLASNRVDGDR